jgi:hypothetical protein
LVARLASWRCRSVWPWDQRRRRRPRLVPLHAVPLQQPADLTVHPTQVVQQPITELAHLIGLMHHRRPLPLYLAADLLGHLMGLLRHPPRLGGDIGPQLLGLLLGLLDDGVGAAPGVLDQLLGRAAGLLQQRGDLPTDLLEGRRPLLKLVTSPWSSARACSALAYWSTACRRRGKLGEVGVDLLAVVAAPHHLKGRRSLAGVPSSLRVRLVRAHDTPSIPDAHNPPLAPRQQDHISSTYRTNRRTQSTARRHPVRQLQPTPRRFRPS